MQYKDKYHVDEILRQLELEREKTAKLSVQLHQQISRLLVPFFLFIHAGIAAGVCRAFRCICLFVHALTGKRLELSTPNLIQIYSIVYSSCSACIDPEVTRSKGQGHTVTKTVTVAWLLVTDHIPESIHLYAVVLPAAIAGVGLHVDTTAYVF